MKKSAQLSEDEMAVAARREYHREWYRKHPGRQKEYNRRYWIKKYREQQEKAR